MEKEKMERISELTRLSRERELTPDELTERAALRAEYIQDWRKSTINVLENTYIVDEKGNKRKLSKKKSAGVGLRGNPRRGFPTLL